MKIPVRPNSHIKPDSQQKLEERESWHKLVVKVILWNERSSSEQGSLRKITQAEWNTYRQQIMKTDVTHSKEEVLSDLKSTLQKIKLNGGFEE